MKDMVHALGESAKHWLQPGDPFRREAIQALPVSTGFTPSMIENALDAAFEELTEDKIREYLKKECPSVIPACCKRESMDPRLRGDDGKLSVLHILAGNVFTSWIHGAAITLLLGHPCWLKPSAHEPVFPPLWKKSLAHVDPALAERVKIVSWQESLLQQVDAVVAYGSNETMQALRSKMPNKIPFVGYGHKFSVAIVFEEALVTGNLSRLREQARRDIGPFHLQGCLSPQTIYVEGGGENILKQLDLHPMPKIQTFSDTQALFQELDRQKPHLSCVGYAGPQHRVKAFEADETIRVCPLGSMQQPPLGWRNGGTSLVEALSLQCPDGKGYNTSRPSAF